MSTARNTASKRARLRDIRHIKVHAQCTHAPPHTVIPLTQPPAHTPAHTLFCSLLSITLLKKLRSMGMLMCWQRFLLQSEAVLSNPNSPGTERILSQALTAVMLQHRYFNNFLSHPLAHPLCTSLPLLSHFPNLYSLSTSLSNLIHFSSI